MMCHDVPWMLGCETGHVCMYPPGRPRLVWAPQDIAIYIVDSHLVNSYWTTMYLNDITNTSPPFREAFVEYWLARPTTNSDPGSISGWVHFFLYCTICTKSLWLIIFGEEMHFLNFSKKNSVMKDASFWCIHSSSRDNPFIHSAWFTF
jgi:hypothetical protein